MSCKLLIWLITTKCNLNCNYCYAKIYNNEKPLELPEIFKIIDQIPQTSINHIDITGGEPLLHKDLFKIIDRIKTIKNITLSIQTNGLLLNDKNLSFLKEREVFINISLNGKETSNDRMRGSGTYKKVIRAINQLSQHDLKFSIVSVISSINYQDVYEVIDIAKDYNANTVYFLPIIPLGKATLDFLPTPKQTKISILKIQEKAEKLKYRVKLWCMSFAKLIINKSDYVWVYPCSPDYAIDLSPGGWSLLCDASFIKLDNVKKIGIKKLIENYTNYSFLKRISFTLSGKCRICKIKDFCRGGCKARSFWVYKNLISQDPLCPA
jgi:radical SAM protein with 4Fe4S-binding SPASM domain